MNGFPWSHLITAEQVLDIHVESIKRYGGGATVRPGDVACAQGRIGNAWNAEGYKDADDDDLEAGLAFAGYLLFYFVKDHCFTDGNKRVAWSSATRVLAQLGLTISATDDEAEAFVDLLIRDGSKSGADAVVWLADRISEAAFDSAGFDESVFDTGSKPKN